MLPGVFEEKRVPPRDGICNPHSNRCRKGGSCLWGDRGRSTALKECGAYRTFQWKGALFNGLMHAYCWVTRKTSSMVVTPSRTFCAPA